MCRTASVSSLQGPSITGSKATVAGSSISGNSGRLTAAANPANGSGLGGGFGLDLAGMAASLAGGLASGLASADDALAVSASSGAVAAVVSPRAGKSVGAGTDSLG